MAEEKQYIPRLAHIKCSYGTKVNYLNVPSDHGIRLASGEPLLNANDHEPGAGKNIVHFGRCQSMTNPGNIALMVVTGGFSETTKNVAGLIEMIPGVDDNLFDGLMCCKCNPKTFTPWEDTSEDHIIDGAPALKGSSQLSCFYGGVIEITDEEIK